MLQNKTGRSSRKYVLAIDVGGTGTKVGLVSQDGELAGYFSGRHETHLLPHGGAEQDPEEWWQVITSGVKHVIGNSDVSPGDIIAIGVTSQWAVTVPVNQQGDPLMNAITWADTRGGKYNAKFLKGFPSVQGYRVDRILRWFNLVGFAPSLDGIEDIGHMLFIKNEHPDIYRQTYKFLEPMDFINMRLTGKACATQNSNFGTVLIDIRENGTKDYDAWALKVSGIDRTKLPDLIPVEGIVGNLQSKIAEEWGLSTDTLVTTSANDNSVALIGSGAVADYEAVAVLGTSGMLVFHLPYKKTDPLHLMTSIPGALNNKYIFWGDTLNTGKVVDSFLRNMVYSQDAFTKEEIPVNIYANLDQAAAQIPAGSDGIIFLPWFTGGTMPPASDPSLRGGYINLTSRTTRNHLARAMLEGITYNWRWLKESAEAYTRQKFPYWRLSGGGASSDVWAQIMADVMGIPMHQLENPSQNTLLGMAFLAFNRLGMLSLDDIPQKVRIKRVYEPDPINQKVYDRMYAQFRECTRRLKPVFHELNKPS